MSLYALRLAKPKPASRATFRENSASVFARNAKEAAKEPDGEDYFVADNFALLKSAGLYEAGVPAELGGGGADIDELAAMLRVLGYHCGSTALAFSMHTHQVAIPAWRWKHQPAATAAVEPLLKRIAKERIQLVSSGGSDWLPGSGKAEKVDGGYRITARKVFSSGSPTGDLLMTAAVLESAGEPPMVLHFGVPMNSPHVKVQDNWRTLGMRGTGSHDVLDRRAHRAGRGGQRVAARPANGTRCSTSSQPSPSRWSIRSISASPKARATSRSGLRKTNNQSPRDQSCRPHGHGTDRSAAGA